MSILLASIVGTHVDLPLLSMHALPDAHICAHPVDFTVHRCVEATHASPFAQNEARQGVVLSVTASSKLQSAADFGLSPALVATRTDEINAPLSPPAVILRYAIAKLFPVKSSFE